MREARHLAELKAHVEIRKTTEEMQRNLPQVRKEKDELKRKEEEVKRKEEEVKRKVEEVWKRDFEVNREEQVVLRRELEIKVEVQRTTEEIRRNQLQVRREKDEVQWKEEEIREREYELNKKDREISRREREIRNWEGRQNGEDNVQEDSEEATPAHGVSETATIKKMNQDLDIFFTYRNLAKAEVAFFSRLPARFHTIVVDKLVRKAVESNSEKVAMLVRDLFSRAVCKELCTPMALQACFMPIAGVIDVVARNFHMAYVFFALMVKAAEFDKTRRLEILSQSVDPDNVLTRYTE